MSDVVGRAVLEITVDDKQYKASLDLVDKRAAETSKHIKGIGQNLNLAVFKEFASKAVDALKMVGGEIIEMGRNGSRVDGMKTSFDTLARSVGATGESMLAVTRDATKGLITDMDLMAATNKAVLLGLPVTTSSMGAMAKAATVLGQAMGQDAKKSLDDLTTALGRGSPLLLDNLGLTARVSEANEAYARTLKKSATDLTDAEKKTAFYNSGMAAAEAKVAQLGEMHITFGHKIQQAQVDLTNFYNELSVGVAKSPVLKAGMDALGKAFGAAVGPDKSQLVKTLVSWIGELGIAAVQAGRVFLWFGQFFAQTFNFAKVIFNAVFEGLFDATAKVTSGLASLAEKASVLPGILGGNEFKQLAGILRADATEAHNLAAGFHANKEAAFDAAQAVQNGYGKASGVLRKVQVAMEATRGAAVATGEAIKAAGPAIAGDSIVPRVEENSRKIADTFRALQEDLAVQGKFGIEKRLTELQFAHDKEVEGYRRLKDVTAAELEKLVAMAGEKHRGLTAVALAGPDQIRDRMLQLQQELSLAQTTGIQQRQMELEFSRQKDIADLAIYKVANVAEYDEMVRLINERFKILRAQAVQTHIDISTSSSVSNDLQRMAAQRTLDAAKANYLQLVAAGEKSNEKLAESKKKWADAEEAIDKLKAKSAIERGLEIAGHASSIIRNIFGKNKAAAIAAATIDTAAAVVSSFRNAGGWPWGAIPAAAMLAAGMRQIATIRSQGAGFAQGTANLDFMGFGKASPTVLHGEEAVIPRGGGHLLAGEIATSMGDQGMSGELLQSSKRIEESLEALPRTMTRAWKNAMATV